jgi:hypothetical protein
MIVQEALREVALGKYFKITNNGLDVSGKPSIDAFADLGEILRTLEHTLPLAIGDFFNEVEDRFGEMASQILDHTGWSEETLRAYRWTSKKVAKDVRRMDALKYSHHQAVAKLSPKEQKKWLNAAADVEDKPWSVSRLKAAIRNGEDPPISAWMLTVECDSEKKRNDLQKELEGRGLICHARERRRAIEKGDGK